jgi:hypothetical protein
MSFPNGFLIIPVSVMYSYPILPLNRLGESVDRLIGNIEMLSNNPPYPIEQISYNFQELTKLFIGNHIQLSKSALIALIRSLERFPNQDPVLYQAILQNFSENLSAIFDSSEETLPLLFRFLYAHNRELFREMMRANNLPDIEELINKMKEYSSDDLIYEIPSLKNYLEKRLPMNGCCLIDLAVFLSDKGRNWLNLDLCALLSRSAIENIPLLNPNEFSAFVNLFARFPHGSHSVSEIMQSAGFPNIRNVAVDFLLYVQDNKKKFFSLQFLKDTLTVYRENNFPIHGYIFSILVDSLLNLKVFDSNKQIFIDLYALIVEASFEDMDLFTSRELADLALTFLNNRHFFSHLFQGIPIDFISKIRDLHPNRQRMLVETLYRTKRERPDFFISISEFLSQSLSIENFRDFNYVLLYFKKLKLNESKIFSSMVNFAINHIDQLQPKDLSNLFTVLPDEKERLLLNEAIFQRYEDLGMVKLSEKDLPYECLCSLYFPHEVIKNHYIAEIGASVDYCIPAIKTMFLRENSFYDQQISRFAESNGWNLSILKV